MLELLVPAGSPEAVVAAVQNGADAVYLGFDGLTGCRAAVNFADAEFERSVRYCRVRGCRVYVALDILVNDYEISRAAGLALRAQRAGADAIVLRDLGVYRVLRQLLPEMPLFAAAEMGFRTPGDAEVAAALGFQRIFLPPELSPKEAARLVGHGVETAILVQGSRCAAESGQCALSFLSGSDSADRGACAQLCRERYSLGGRWDTTPLSYKDRCLLARLPELDELGFDCIYLGGREKRPEYVAAYTAAYARALSEGTLPGRAELEELHGSFTPFGVSEEPEPVTETAEPDGRELEKYCGRLRKSYTGTELRRVGVEFAAVARGENSRMRIGVVDEDGNKEIIDGPLPICFGDVPITDSAMSDALYRTGGTPYHCTGCRAASAPELSVSSADLDSARAVLLERLTEKRGAAPKRREGSFPAGAKDSSEYDEPVFSFSFLSPAQMTPELADLRPRLVLAPLELLCGRPELLRPFTAQGCTAVAVLPPAVCGEKEEAQLDVLLAKALELGIDEVEAPNLALALRAMQAGLKVRGGAELGVFNSFALINIAAAGFLSTVVSPQLSLDQVQTMAKPMDTELIVYGRLPAMVTDRCLMKASAGRCICATPAQMADTHGGVWPVVKTFGCRNTVYAAKKLFLADRAEDWRGCGVWAVRLAFSTESPRECLEVAKSYIRGTGYRPNGLTHGAFYKGVR